MKRGISIIFGCPGCKPMIQYVHRHVELVKEPKNKVTKGKTKLFALLPFHSRPRQVKYGTFSPRLSFWCNQSLEFFFSLAFVCILFPSRVISRWRRRQYTLTDWTREEVGTTDLIRPAYMSLVSRAIRQETVPYYPAIGCKHYRITQQYRL